MDNKKGHRHFFSFSVVVGVVAYQTITVIRDTQRNELMYGLNCNKMRELLTMYSLFFIIYFSLLLFLFSFLSSHLVCLWSQRLLSFSYSCVCAFLEWAVYTECVLSSFPFNFFSGFQENMY